MTNPVSRFVWYDVMTTDIDAAEDFYAEVIGWTMKDSEMDGPRYTLLMDGERSVGGIMKIPDEAAAAGAPPAWMGYVGVDDVDAKADELQAAGGKLHRPLQDIPGVGRFGVVSDPHGAAFIIFQPKPKPKPKPIPDPAQEPAPFMAPGTIGWHELHSGNMEEVWPFYEKLFGWEKDEAVDMGPFVYQTYKTGDEHATGGMMTKMESAPYPFWAYYISVDDIDATVERVKANGGQMLMDVMQVPGGMWIAPARDPQGAHFNLIGSRKHA